MYEKLLYKRASGNLKDPYVVEGLHRMPPSTIYPREIRCLTSALLKASL